MMRGKFILATLAIAGFTCVAALNVASAASPADVTAPAGAQRPVRLAQATVTTPKPAKKTKRLKVEHPRTNWLNPQPEPDGGQEARAGQQLAESAAGAAAARHDEETAVETMRARRS